MAEINDKNLIVYKEELVTYKLEEMYILNRSRPDPNLWAVNLVVFSGHGCCIKGDTCLIYYSKKRENDDEGGYEKVLLNLDAFARKMA